MKLPRFLRLNTLAGWLMCNIVAAMFLVIVLNVGIVLVFNAWARPNFEEGGTMQQMTMAKRALDATPRDERQALARAMGDGNDYGVDWYPDRASVPMPANTAKGDDFVPRFRQVFGAKDVLAYDPFDATRAQRVRQPRYMLAVQMQDGSWAVFSAAERTWGVDKSTRLLVAVLFMLISSLTVAALASRRLARPMRRLADGAERFGADVQAPQVTPEGPHELQVAMRAFNDMQARIQRFVRDRTELLAAISHDLRAPLTRIRLRGEYIDEPVQQRKLFADVDEMRSMVDAALAFFRNDGEEEAPTRFDLARLVGTVIDDCGDEGGEATYEGPERYIYEGRPKSLKRAIANLAANAVRYGGAAHIVLDTVDGHVRIRVLDHGPGIPASLMDSVFRPFFRAEGSRNRHTGGVGLGLPTARNIVRGHGGDVTLAPAQGGGLEATVLLPRPT